MKRIKIFTLFLLLLCMYVFVSAYCYAANISERLSDEVLRLHVIANSDSEEDQTLKYMVRDTLMNYMNSLCEDSTSKEETIEIVSNHLDDFENLANLTINENGFSYSAQVELGNFEFPTKTYGDISFPAGYYDALKVKLGNAHGKNWWCVLYPSLCFINENTGIVTDEAKKQLQQNLSEEEYNIISDKEDTSIHIKFKLIELLAKKKLLVSKK